MEPRGIRNCNPGNIRITKDRWQGLREVQADGEFFQFVTMAYGYRALIRCLQNYRKRHGCRTIRDFISRWAPATENDTGAYVRAVCGKMGVEADFVPNVDDKVTMCMMAAAISYVENGRLAEMEEVSDGWELL